MRHSLSLLLQQQIQNLSLNEQVSCVSKWGASLFIYTILAHVKCLFTGRVDFSNWVVMNTFIIFRASLISFGADFLFFLLQLSFDQSAKGDLVLYNNRHDQSVMGIDPMNNISNNNKNTLSITLFQNSPLTRRVFFNNIKREREDNIINNIEWVRGQHHQYHLGTLTGVSINHQKFSSSEKSSFSKECNHQLHQYGLV